MMLPRVAIERACVAMGLGSYIKNSSGKAARTPDVHWLSAAIERQHLNGMSGPLRECSW